MFCKLCHEQGGKRINYSLSLNPFRSQWSKRRQQSSSTQAGLGQATGVHSSSSRLPPSLPQLSISSSISASVVHLQLHLCLSCPSPGIQCSVSDPLPRWNPCQRCIWMVVHFHAKNMAKPFPAPLLHLSDTIVDACSLPDSLLVTFCSHQMRRILLRHLPSNNVTTGTEF